MLFASRWHSRQSTLRPEVGSFSIRGGVGGTLKQVGAGEGSIRVVHGNNDRGGRLGVDGGGSESVLVVSAAKEMVGEVFRRGERVVIPHPPLLPSTGFLHIVV
jgi:hypothetical protein